MQYGLCALLCADEKSRYIPGAVVLAFAKARRSHFWVRHNVLVSSWTDCRSNMGRLIAGCRPCSPNATPLSITYLTHRNRDEPCAACEYGQVPRAPVPTRSSRIPPRIAIDLFETDLISSLMKHVTPSCPYAHRSSRAPIRKSKTLESSNLELHHMSGLRSVCFSRPAS